jgi:carbamoyltransferase
MPTHHAVLGLGGSNHDFSAAIVSGGVIQVAIEDERIQRVKRGRSEWYAKPARDAATYCLDALELRVEDLDGLFCCDDLERPTAWLDWGPFHFVNHHTAHAAASFFAFPYKQATLLVVDGHGSPCAQSSDGFEVETISIGSAKDTSLSVHPLQTGTQKQTSSSWRYVTQNSIGWFYNVVTMALGFGAGEQGKSMGLAAYGSPVFVEALREFVAIEPDGRFVFDPYGGIWDWLNQTLAAFPRSVQVRADLAYAAQEIFVDAIVAAAWEAYRQAPSPILSFGGGCALNTLANTRILEATPFEQVNVFPAAGDNGLSVGAAYYGAHVLLGAPRAPVAPGWRGRVVYTGREYDEAEVRAALADAPVTASRPADLVGEIAEVLVGGGTVAVCRGGSEIGPRALGNRSLLALPANAAMRDHINLNIKQRESFRPLAPVVALEDLATYFTGVDESPYMLLVAEVRDEFRDQLAAVTHVDGTARVQTVRTEDNGLLHGLLEQVGEATGIPVILNTSLNFPGKPIVETPADALELFVQRPIDVLVLGDWVVRKYSPWVPTPSLAGASSHHATRLAASTAPNSRQVA